MGKTITVTEQVDIEVDLDDFDKQDIQEYAAKKLGLRWLKDAEHRDTARDLAASFNPARDEFAREEILLGLGLTEPLERIEQMLARGEIEAAQKALSAFIRPALRAPLTWSPKAREAASGGNPQ